VELLDDALEHGAQQLRDGRLTVAEQHRTVVDAALGVGFEAGRLQPGAVHRVTADDDRAVRLGVHRRGEDRRPVEEQRARPAIRTAHHRDGVRRSQVDTELHPCRGHRSECRPGVQWIYESTVP
jgi:hypothetical protein